MIADWTKRHDKHEAMRLIGAAGVPAGAVLDTMELMNEPSFTERGILQTACSTRPGRSRCRLAGALRRRPPPVEPAPLLGEHSAEVFGEWLGMSVADIEKLRKEGAI